jgi:hypothetical protein
MNFHERILRVLHHQPADRIPFAPYDNLVPRGSFERELRSRGMGLLKRVEDTWSTIPGVREETSTIGDETTVTYHTPVGSVSSRWKVHAGRISDDGTVQIEWPIKCPDDCGPVLYMIENSECHPNYSAIHDSTRDLGDDGLVCASGFRLPYENLWNYFGLANWSYAQMDYPEQVSRLHQALWEQEGRRCPIMLDSPVEYLNFGSLSGFYGPKQFQEYILPFCQKYVPLLKERGKIGYLHAHNSNLTAFRDLLHETGIQVIEAYTPPPISDCPIEEARRAWGKETVIWVNFPETMFWSGKGETYRYTLNLFKSDPCPDRLIMGITELGLLGVDNDESERSFRDGFTAIMDAIDDFSRGGS